MTDFTNYILDNADNITFFLILFSIVIFVVVGIIYYYANDKKIRLTCDIRFQPNNELKDPRYFGPKPTVLTVR